MSVLGPLRQIDNLYCVAHRVALRMIPYKLIVCNRSKTTILMSIFYITNATSLQLKPPIVNHIILRLPCEHREW